MASSPPDGAAEEEWSESSAMTDDEMDEEPVLKYQRMRADIGKLLEDGEQQVVSIAIHETFLAVATAAGTVYLSDFHGNERRRLRPHRGRINDISIDLTGEFIATCGDDGTVVINCLQLPDGAGGVVGGGGGGGGDDGSNGRDGASNGTSGTAMTSSEEVYRYRGPMRAVCLDPQYARRRDKLFVAGGDRGQLVLNRKGWFRHKETILHEGEGPVVAAAWRGSLVAWGNDQGLKIMDVEKEERISYVDKPRAAVGSACRCHLLWETDTRLVFAWADTVVILHIITKEAPGIAAAAVAVTAGAAAVGGSSGMGASLSLASSGAAQRMTAAILDPALTPPQQRVAEIATLWQADCLICGISPFDAKSFLLLGCVPNEPEYTEEGSVSIAGTAGRATAVASRSPAAARRRGEAASAALAVAVVTSVVPEVHLVRRATGEVYSADALPLRGSDRAMVSDYMLQSTSWLVGSQRRRRSGGSGGVGDTGAGFWSSGGGGGGGDGGGSSAADMSAPPAVFLASPHDIVLARVRDVDDQIEWSLQHGDVWDALQLALANRNVLRLHSFDNLVGRYLEDLMDRDRYEEAAAECPRLLGDDAMAWERWVYAFARRRQLAAIAPVVPVAAPRLPAGVYEMILDHLL
ncbi:unnamed protein product, partial [Phaeothamnion confervicola]